MNSLPNFKQSQTVSLAKLMLIIFDPLQNHLIQSTTKNFSCYDRKVKYLGIDYGTKRVGIALSDEAGEFAFPKSIFNRQTALEEIALLCEQEKIDAVVIGESLATNESENEVVEKTKQFALQLQEKINLPVHFEQEMFSSVEAHRYQTKAGSRDDSAAAIILQRYLDKLDKKKE